MAIKWGNNENSGRFYFLKCFGNGPNSFWLIHSFLHLFEMSKFFHTMKLLFSWFLNFPVFSMELSISVSMLLLLLSCFSRVRLCVTPETAAHQAPLSLGFSRQEYWSGLPFPSQCMKVKSDSEVSQPCLTLCDPLDCSLTGSSVHGIFQARVLE